MKAAISRYCVAILTFFTFVSIAVGQESQQLGQHVREYRSDGAVRQYLFFLPGDYGKEDRQWPMIV